ncbi:MAG TPA: tetratricopeptide repeat protein, partial [Rhodothermales bacterium]|nr:tetratricopeptide repeat protein [Rhodothermales bacterium]
ATLRSATKLLSERLGPRSIKAAQAKNNLAVLLEESGDVEQAESLYREALEVWESSLQPNHPTLAKGWHNLAMLLRDQERPEESLEYYSRAVRGYRSHGNLNRESLGDVLIGQAKVQRSVGDLVGAASSFRESLAIRQEELPPGHWRIGTAMSLLGETLGQLGEREEAEAMLRSGLEILTAALGPDDEKTHEAEERLRRFRPAVMASAG